MNILKNLSSALLAGLVSLSTLVSAGSIEIQAGSMPFTLYNEGNVRVYYDEYSRPNQLSYIDSNGNQYATQEIAYDTYGFVDSKKLTESRGFWYSRISTFKYTYTQTNRIYEERQSYGWGTRSLSYHYDLFGNLDNIQAYEGIFFLSAKEKVSNRYTSDSKLEARTYYNANGSVALHQEFSYDFQGRAIEKRIFDQNLNLVSRICFDFDVATGVDMETNYDAQGNITSLVYNYRDDQGRLFERALRDAAGSLVAATKYEYNWNNQLVRLTDMDANARTLGCVSTSFDMQSRPYLYEFSYGDNDLLVERVKSVLCLPGTDL